jgi:hypothetical protein
MSPPSPDDGNRRPLLADAFAAAKITEPLNLFHSRGNTYNSTASLEH